MPDPIAPDSAVPNQQNSGLSLAPGEMVLVARLVRPQGRHGEILADILTDFPERFSERKRLFLLTPPRSLSGSPPGSSVKPDSLPREVSLERHWLHKGRVVLKFSGVDSINDAEPLRGLEVAIPREERAALDEGSAYIDDLVGCAVFDLGAHGTAGKPAPREAREVGQIVSVDRESTAHPLLVVRGRQSPAGAEDILIPYVQPFVVQIDVAGRRIDMRLPDGLLELNAPLTPEERRQQQEEQERAVGKRDGDEERG